MTQIPRFHAQLLTTLYDVKREHFNTKNIYKRDKA